MPQRPYSNIEHLARSIWLSRYSSENLIAMFTAYFDASGRRDTRVLTMAGFVSDVRKWAKFDGKWSAILKRENIPAFHMTDFVARKPPFDCWQGRDADRDLFFRDLLATAVKYTHKAFSAMLQIGRA